MTTLKLITKFKCDDCGAYPTKPFDNGDEKRRCECCATAKYYRDVPCYLRQPIKINSVIDLGAV